MLDKLREAVGAGGPAAALASELIELRQQYVDDKLTLEEYQFLTDEKQMEKHNNIIIVYYYIISLLYTIILYSFSFASPPPSPPSLSSLIGSFLIANKGC
jgi:hypothetical protein